MQQRSEDEEKKGAASKRQTSVAESFGTDRHLTGTERVMLLAEFVTVIQSEEAICVSWASVCVMMLKYHALHLH